MEKIDSTSSSANASEVLRDKNLSPATLVIKSSKADEILKSSDATDISAKTDQSRIESAKNIEMIRDRLTEITNSLNVEMKNRSKNLEFSVDPVTNRLLVTVSDKESGKVIGQIPSEATLKLVKFIQDGVDVTHSLEALKGLLYDDKY
jgi:flagellar protein FlaG